MKKILLTKILLFSFFANAQNTAIENGTYIAKSKGQVIKLIISENKNFNLSFMSGKFEIKNDSIIFKNPQDQKSAFDLVYTFGQNIKFDKIRIKLASNTYDLSSIYISSFNGSSAPIYKRISDILNENNNNIDDGIAIFEIDRADFLVLAKENYLNETEIFKFKLDNNISEINIKDSFNDNSSLKLSGVFDKNNQTMTVSENSRNPLIFQLESQIVNTENNTVAPIDSKKIINWTYPGKDNNQVDDAKSAEFAETSVDSAATATPEPAKFELKVEKNYLEALKETAKTSQKFLVISYDPKNKEEKNQFNDFVKTQSSNIQYNMYDKYDPQYDLYNYYLATKHDNKWFNNNNIKDFPCVVVVNSKGEILSQANKSIFDLQDQFHYYDDFNKKLKRSNTLLSFKNSLTKKQADLETIKSFSEITSLEIPNEPITPAVDPVKLEDIKFDSPKIVEVNDSKQDDKVVDEIKASPDSETVVEKIDQPQVIETVYEDVKPNFNTFAKIDFDKKQVESTWSNLIQNHKNDSKPNIDLVLIILAELKNEGFTKQIFNEEKILNTTSFDALDYILSHFDAIEKARINSKYNVDAIHNIDFLEIEIAKILTSAVRLIKTDTPIAIQQKIVSYYKKLQAIDINNNEINIDYFQLLKDIAFRTNSETQYIQEYDSFYQETFDGKINIFEKLDDLFSNQNHSGLDYWSEFKNSYSNLSNDAAWYVVEHSKNPETIKKAIKWSENSLIITQKNPFYLDTLAQLYYKNGEKQKALKTQQLAIDNNNLEEESRNSYKATLEKMKNGTY